MADHNQAPLVTVGRVLCLVSLEERVAPLKVGDRRCPSTETQVDEGLREIEGRVGHDRDRTCFGISPAGAGSEWRGPGRPRQEATFSYGPLAEAVR